MADPAKGVPGVSGSNDGQLVRAVRAGNREAFDLLLQHHQGLVRKIISTYVEDGEEAENLWQEVVATAFEQLARLRRPEVFGPWLKRITVHCCLSWQRRNGKNPVCFVSWSEGQWDQAMGTEPSPEQILLRREMQRLVRQAVLSLPGYESDVVWWCDLEGYTCRELAALWGWTERKVIYWRRRGRKRLRQILQNLFSEEN